MVSIRKLVHNFKSILITEFMKIIHLASDRHHWVGRQHLNSLHNYI